ncbi:hypothetical protein L1987_14343 [Smallanthus sonchifolius]|uniref:Uncharacterized protein n=1 Tax=Smallanthus sonchifolius TaxID=185202 RepID=A0ACB9J3E4_9ASTR|nr:hypothetical protein L1987_14343 [Smallanthus sonchifolius]
MPPDLILFHILPWLPCKTIVRFRSFCKQWHSFLNTRTFCNLHLHHHVTNKLLVKSITTPCKFFSIDCEAPHESLGLTTPFEASDPRYVSILTSCNGMICIGMKKRIYDQEYEDLMLWNPLTSDRIQRWRMNEEGDWTMVKTCLPKPSSNKHLKPLHLMRNGNWLIHFGGGLYSVDMDDYMINGDNSHPLNKSGCVSRKKGNTLRLLNRIRSSVDLWFFSIDCDAPDEGFSTLTLPFKASDPDNVSILASCNGMICIGMQKRISYVDEYADLILWNPLTSEYKTLSKTNSNRECYEKSCSCDGFRMYYSSSEDDYRLLRVTKSCNAYIYSLKSDSWRKIESTGLNWNFYQWMPSVLLDEKDPFVEDERRWRLDQCGDDLFAEPSDNYHMSPLHLMRNGNWLMHFGCYLYNVDMEK